MPLSLHDAFLQVAPQIDWGNIDAIREALIGLPEFDLHEALGSPDDVYKNFANVRIRRLLRTFVDETGFPVFANTEHQREDGTTERVYKQEALFNVDDYTQVVTYWVERTNNSASMARAYCDRAEGRFQIQIPLQFNLNGGQP